MALLIAPIFHLFYQSRREGIGHQKRHRQVDNDNPGKVIQVFLDKLWQPEHHHQRTNGCQQSRQNRQERLSVAVITIVIGHHHRRVNHQT